MGSSISPTVILLGRASRRGEPTWELALLFPFQGEWTESAYLALDTNRLIELSDGCLEFLPMPTVLHQLIMCLAHCCVDIIGQHAVPFG